MKIAGTDTKTSGSLPEKGMVFPEFTLKASDDRSVSQVDFDGRRKVFFFCFGPEHEATASFIASSADVVDAANAVLIPVSRTPTVEWRRFLHATGVEGIAPLSVDAELDVPFPVVDSGAWKQALAPALVVVDDQDEVFGAQLATDADTLAGLDVKALLTALPAIKEEAGEAEAEEEA